MFPDLYLRSHIGSDDIWCSGRNEEAPSWVYKEINKIMSRYRKNKKEQQM